VTTKLVYYKDEAPQRQDHKGTKTTKITKKIGFVLVFFVPLVSLWCSGSGFSR